MPCPYQGAMTGGLADDAKTYLEERVRAQVYPALGLAFVMGFSAGLLIAFAMRKP